jgi:uncharacterized protein (TIGR00375 family)
MKYIADLHLHSHYSRATSKELTPEHLDYWARLKGIKVVGTGDFTHPGWFNELKEKLEPAEQGLFRLRNQFKQDIALQTPFAADQEVRFVLSAEISSIYKKYDRVRKVHNLILAPDFETVEKIQIALGRIGNLKSDGRPILGLDSRDLLEICLQASDQIFFIPAHIWTPWFSMLGDKSGFDSIDECFGDLSDHIHAIETGLSSDPPMNWMCSFLDRCTLLSNSDAHSPEKLGRNANIFNTELSYPAMIQAIRSADAQLFSGTIEMFPQEGKYHYDGHRKCGVCWDPVQTLQHREICPVCGKKVTVGVMNRVVQLSDRTNLEERPNRSPYFSLIPLKEMLAEIHNCGETTKAVTQAYQQIIQKAGSEFNVLLHYDLAELKTITNEVVVEAIRRMREGEIFIEEGCDGEYGKIRVFDDEERGGLQAGKSLFGMQAGEKKRNYHGRRLINFSLDEYRALQRETFEPPVMASPAAAYMEESCALDGLNEEQRQAVQHFHGPELVIAGPGAGKTRLLVHRIAQLIRERHVSPETILAITFTNKAAGEIRQRLTKLIGAKKQEGRPLVSTFHALGYSILRDQAGRLDRRFPFIMLDDDRERILSEIAGVSTGQAREIGEALSKIKQFTGLAGKIETHVTGATVASGPEEPLVFDPGSAEISDAAPGFDLWQLTAWFDAYEAYLDKINALDLDDLIYKTVRLFDANPDILALYRERFQWILVDEYQDINQAQYQLIRRLAPASQSNLCVIGDPNQAIYGFRGASSQFIRRFLGDYPEAQKFTLKRSYRCSGQILKASSHVLRGEDAAGAALLDSLQAGLKINIAPQSSDKSEAEFVARTIEQMVGGLRFFSMDSAISGGEQDSAISSLSDFAILCRIGLQMPFIEKALNDHSIPFQAVREKYSLNDEPARSALDILKSITAPENPFLRKKATEGGRISEAAFNRLQEMTAAKKPLKQILTTITDLGFSREKSAQGPQFKELIETASAYGSDVQEFLRVAALGSAVDALQLNTEKVSILTLHAAKGLEFKCVFIVGCEDGLLPYRLFEKQTADPDEERRLLYVGMTRAEKHLFITYAANRFLMGREYHLPRSPFLDRIEQDLIEYRKAEYKKPLKKNDGQLSLF